MNTKQEVQSVGLTELELIARLQSTFNEDLRCESHHSRPGNETCSGEVTNIVKYCQGEFFACSNHIRWMASGSATHCSMCEMEWGVCWKIIPI